MIRKAVAAKPEPQLQAEKPTKGAKGRKGRSSACGPSEGPEGSEAKPSPRARASGGGAPRAQKKESGHADQYCQRNNEKIGNIELQDEVFGGRVKADLIWEAVVQANASERRGTHATKNRAAVSGSGKKPWRQKGTGRARVGEIRNPLWRKGGTVFGPQPRSYAFDLPKKVNRGALRAALAQKLSDGAVIVIDRLDASSARRRTPPRCSSGSVRPARR